MLGKLIRYEWKNTYKICGSLLLFLAIMTIVVGLSLQTPFWGGLFTGNGRAVADSGGWGAATTMLRFLGMILYFLTLFGVSIGLFIYLGVRFYKTMYSDEGYLTHTLPVTSRQLLNSKLLVGSLWSLAVFVMIALSISGMVFAVASTVISTVRDYPEWNSIAPITYGEAFGAIWEVIQEILGEAGVGEILLQLAMLLVSVVNGMMILFGSITLGQLSTKYRVMMSIVWYFVIQLSLTLVNNWILMPLLYSGMAAADWEYSGLISVLTPGNLANLMAQLIVTIVLYFLSNYIITYKLNLE